MIDLIITYDAWVQRNFDRVAHAFMRRGITKRLLRLGFHLIVIAGLILHVTTLIMDKAFVHAMVITGIIGLYSWVVLLDESADAKAENTGLRSRADLWSGSIASRLFTTCICVASWVTTFRVDGHDRVYLLRWYASDMSLVGYWLLAYLHQTDPTPPPRKDRVLVPQLEAS